MVITVLLLLALLGPASVEPAPAYRRAEWNHWTGRCLNTRERVLIAESRRPVTLSPDGCGVLSGEWLDEYTGELVTVPAVLDVDHMIPLAFAHRAGGWRWTRATKTAYANDLTPEHLIAVTREANRAKGDKGPDRWKPTRRAAWCAYAEAWGRIAARWELSLTASEQRALRAMRATCRPPGSGQVVPE